jgi:hypothetical protein
MRPDPLPKTMFQLTPPCRAASCVSSSACQRPAEAGANTGSENAPMAIAPRRYSSHFATYPTQ